MTPNILKTILLCAAVALSATAFPQQLTLQQSRQMALQNNKQIKVAEQQKTKAALTAHALKTNYLPKVSASAMAYYNNKSNDFALQLGQVQLFNPDELGAVLPPNLLPVFQQFASVQIPDMNFSLKTSNTYIGGINIEQPIYTGGKIGSAYAMAKIGGEIAEINTKLTENQVILKTDEAYWMFVQAVELQKSAASYLGVVEEFHRVVNNAVQAGMRTKNDVMKVQVQLNRAKLQLQRAENGVRLARMNLCQMVGLPLASEIWAAESFGESALIAHTTADAAIAARPEYAILNKQIELKEQEKRLVRSDFMPTVGVRGSYNYLHGIRLNNQTLLNNGVLSAVVSVNVPLFHWGEGAKKIKAAETERVIMQLQLNDAGEKMELELMQAQNTYREQLLEVELTQTALAQARENLTLSRNHYEAGMETVSDYLEAQALLQNAETELIVAKAKLEIGKTTYLKAAGQL